MARARSTPSSAGASDDFAPILTAFGRLAAIPAAEQARARELLRVRDFEPQAWIVRAGERCRWVGFVVRGLVRHVRWDGERETDAGFDFEGRFVTDLESFLAGAPARHSIQALEPTRMLVLDRRDLDELYSRHACWERVGRKLLEEQLLRKQRKEDDLRLRSPRDRYLRMVERRPYLVGRVPLRHLASYLGMEPETLSRVRARLAREA